jgi:hypothetical protein
MSAILSRVAILTADDLKTQDIDCPEWGGAVRIRVMTGAERGAMSKRAMDMQTAGDLSTDLYNAMLVAACCIGEDGARLFSDDDVHAIAAKHSGVLARLSDAAAKLNLIGPGAAENEAGN